MICEPLKCAQQKKSEYVNKLTFSCQTVRFCWITNAAPCTLEILLFRYCLARYESKPFQDEHYKICTLFSRIHFVFKYFKKCIISSEKLDFFTQAYLDSTKLPFFSLQWISFSVLPLKILYYISSEVFITSVSLYL